MSKPSKRNSRTVTFDMADPRCRERAYKEYRRVLRSLRGTYQRTDSRSSASRQSAREAIVKRYGISFADVKALIAEFDERYNVTHEHTENYLRRCRAEEAQKVFDADPQPCANTGTSCPEVGPRFVRVRYNPLTLKTHGRWDLTIICIQCHMALEDAARNLEVS